LKQFSFESKPSSVIMLECKKNLYYDDDVMLMLDDKTKITRMS